MDCNATRRLLDADTDGELDLVHHLELAAHLRTCPACLHLADAARARRAVLCEKLPRFPAPAGLAARIRAALPESAAPARPPAHAPRRSLLLWPGWSIAGLAAVLACALLLGFAWGNARARADRLFDEVVSGHIRSLQAGHLTDVASTDQHAVKPWFAGRLDFSPPVADLATAGFPLAGGRLEHVDGRPAAALVFHRRQHALNLFIWPAGPVALPERSAVRNGYHVATWSQAGFNFAAISEIPADELGQFVTVFRGQMP